VYSLLFRRETSRRLRKSSGAIIDAYLQRRFPWLDAYTRPSRATLATSLEMLAEAVARDDVMWYREYLAELLQGLISQGLPPIAVLAAEDLLYEIVPTFLTPDQRELVSRVLDAERRQRQSIVYDTVIGSATKRGA
jgi:transcriptional regulator of nitric oxide reductase